MEILSIKDTATFINRTEGAIRKLCLRRAIPFRKPAGRLIFIRSELERWIENAPGVGLQDIKNE
ncbi:MAG: helix-turn-helix domain-containing protein [Deltaproteobacteria bacterium]|nr:helix-turn-helix domain-containing protein [Deltaproteobacteria bacterium]